MPPGGGNLLGDEILKTKILGAPHTGREGAEWHVSASQRDHRLLGSGILENIHQISSTSSFLKALRREPTGLQDEARPVWLARCRFTVLCSRSRCAFRLHLQHRMIGCFLLFPFLSDKRFADSFRACVGTFAFIWLLAPLARLAGLLIRNIQKHFAHFAN